MINLSTSFKSADDPSELFKKMFFDSEVAGGYSRGRTKTTYIVKYGLSDIFKDMILYMKLVDSKKVSRTVCSS